jgi:hypothetical protein
MPERRRKRPRDPAQLAKLMIAAAEPDDMKFPALQIVPVDVGDLELVAGLKGRVLWGASTIAEIGELEPIAQNPDETCPSSLARGAILS